MNHLSLFSGIGGIDIAAHWAGFETVAFVERDAYCQTVLARKFPGVPIYDDVTTFDGRQYRGVDLVSGGFPCQPHSVAGKRKASGDERELWGEVVRILGEAEPRWFLGENVPGLLSSQSGRFFGRVVNDLAALGYRVGWSCYGASDVGACHRRKRVFIVAYSDSLGSGTPTWLPETWLEDLPDSDRSNGSGIPTDSKSEQNRRQEFGGIQSDVRAGDATDSSSVRREGLPESGLDGQDDQERKGRRTGEPAGSELPAHSENVFSNGGNLEPEPESLPESGNGDSTQEASNTSCGRLSWESRGRAGTLPQNGYRELPSRDWRTWAVKPVFRSGDDGVPDYMVRHRVNVLKALGNAVVPQQVYPILKAIAEASR